VDVDLGAEGVLAGIGQGFLDDPVGGAAGQVGDGAAGLVVQGHPHPGPARLGDELVDVGEGRLGQLPDRGRRPPGRGKPGLRGLDLGPNGLGRAAAGRR